MFGNLLKDISSKRYFPHLLPLAQNKDFGKSDAPVSLALLSKSKCVTCNPLHPSQRCENKRPWLTSYTLHPERSP